MNHQRLHMRFPSHRVIPFHPRATRAHRSAQLMLPLVPYRIHMDHGANLNHRTLSNNCNR